jgi:hypothetical protein
MAMWTECERGTTKGTQVVPSGAWRSQTSRTQHYDIDAIVRLSRTEEEKGREGFHELGSERWISSRQSTIL